MRLGNGSESKRQPQGYPFGVPCGSFRLSIISLKHLLSWRCQRLYSFLNLFRVLECLTFAQLEVDAVNQGLPAGFNNILRDTYGIPYIFAIH